MAECITRPEQKDQTLQPSLTAKPHWLKLNLAHIRACFLAPSKSIENSLSLSLSSPLFCFFLWTISKKEVGAWRAVLTCLILLLFLYLLFAVISSVHRLWLPDQAADGSGRRALGACPGGGSWPHGHMWCLWSLRLCSARQWGKMRTERRMGALPSKFPKQGTGIQHVVHMWLVHKLVYVTQLHQLSWLFCEARFFCPIFMLFQIKFYVVAGCLSCNSQSEL